MLQWSPSSRIFNDRSCARCLRQVRNRIRHYVDVSGHLRASVALSQDKWPAEVHLVSGWRGPQVWTWWRGTGKSTAVIINTDSNCTERATVMLNSGVLTLTPSWLVFNVLDQLTGVDRVRTWLTDETASITTVILRVYKCCLYCSIYIHFKHFFQFRKPKPNVIKADFWAVCLLLPFCWSWRTPRPPNSLNCQGRFS